MSKCMFNLRTRILIYKVSVYVRTTIFWPRQGYQPRGPQTGSRRPIICTPLNQAISRTAHVKYRFNRIKPTLDDFESVEPPLVPYMVLPLLPKPPPTRLKSGFRKRGISRCKKEVARSKKERASPASPMLFWTSSA